MPIHHSSIIRLLCVHFVVPKDSSIVVLQGSAAKLAHVCSGERGSFVRGYDLHSYTLPR